MKAMRFQWLVHTCLGSWAVLMVIIGASLMVNHWVPLPRPELEQSVGKTSLASLQTADADNRWVAIHFLYAECPCSRRVLDYLLEQPPRTDVSERVVLIGDAEELALKAEAQGYAVDVVGPEELLTRYGVEAATSAVTPRGNNCSTFKIERFSNNCNPDKRSSPCRSSAVPCPEG
jgi:hypothetical protein